MLSRVQPGIEEMLELVAKLTVPAGKTGTGDALVTVEVQLVN